MLKMMRKQLSNKKGFTLIELIVVIAILGILAGVAVPRLTGFQEDAKKKADINNARAIANAIMIAEAQGDVIIDYTNEKMTLVGTAVSGGSDTVVKSPFPLAEASVILNEYFDTIPEIKATDGTFTVEINTDKSLSITDDTDEIYPSQENTYSN